MKKPNTKKYKIEDSPFYRLRTRKKLATILYVSESNLQGILKLSKPYKQRWRHKPTGKWLNHPPSPDVAHEYRPISIPCHAIKKIQGRIKDLLHRIETPGYLYSPVKGRSYVDNARCHINTRAKKFLDIEDFFPSCTREHVARFFRKNMECSPDVTAILVDLVTLDGCLPQGSKCSPILAYFCNSDAFAEVAKIVQAAGCNLSIYADDITISGPVVKESMVWQAKMILRSNRLKINKEKEGSSIDKPSSITGVIVSGGNLRLPNNKRKKLKEVMNQYKEAQNLSEKKALLSKITGRLAQKKQIED